MDANFPEGNELIAYVATKFNEWRSRLWSPEITEAVETTGCDVEKHQRGFRSWADLGAHIVIVSGPGRAGSDLAEYDAIREKTRSALDEQLRQHVFVLGAEIECFLGIRCSDRLG
jgi:hypothetical protein